MTTTKRKFSLREVNYLNKHYKVPYDAFRMYDEDWFVLKYPIIVEGVKLEVYY